CSDLGLAGTMPKALRAVQLPGVVGTMDEICGRNMTTSVLARGGAGQAVGEVGGADFTYDTQIGPFVTVAGEEQDRRRAEQLVAVEQGALVLAALGDVETDQPVATQLRGDRR